MKRFFYLFLPTILLLLSAGTEAYARSTCRAICLPVRSWRDNTGEKYYFPRSGWTQTMSETARDSEDAFEALEKRCDGEDEMLVIAIPLAIGPYGSYLIGNLEADEDNACSGRRGSLDGDRSIQPAHFEYIPKQEHRPSDTDNKSEFGTSGA